MSLGENDGIEPQFGLPSDEAHRLANLTAYLPEDVERALTRFAPCGIPAADAAAFILQAHGDRMSPDRMEWAARCERDAFLRRRSGQDPTTT